MAGLTLAVPLVCLGSIYSLAGRELTPLFGQPDLASGMNATSPWATLTTSWRAAAEKLPASTTFTNTTISASICSSCGTAKSL